MAEKERGTSQEGSGRGSPEAREASHHRPVVKMLLRTPLHIVCKWDSEMTEISRSIVLRPYPTDYVYLHFHPQRPDEVVYVGRGSGGRAWLSDNRRTDHQVWMMEWQAQG